MNAQRAAQQAYASSTSPHRTSRGTEYEVFSRITRRLHGAVQASPQNFSSLVQALHENRELWTLLATDVADKDNKLPAPLRAQIFYLAEFTNHHTRLVLSQDASADVLVEINTAVMRGLRNQRVPQ